MKKQKGNKMVTKKQNICNEVCQMIYDGKGCTPDYNTDIGYTLMKLTLEDLEFLLLTLKS